MKNRLFIFTIITICIPSFVASMDIQQKTGAITLGREYFASRICSTKLRDYSNSFIKNTLGNQVEHNMIKNEDECAIVMVTIKPAGPLSFVYYELALPMRTLEMAIPSGIITFSNNSQFTFSCKRGELKFLHENYKIFNDQHKSNVELIMRNANQ